MRPGEQPARFVVPSDQRLDANDPARRELDLRLIVELELAVLQCRSELFGDAHPLMHVDDLFQQQVAHRMAERIVYVLEVVDVELEHGKVRCAAPARGEHHGQPFYESAAVRKIGQEIGLREIENSAVGMLEAPSMAQ